MLLIHESRGKSPCRYVTCAAVQLAHSSHEAIVEETFVITVFVLIHAQFRILVGGTGRNVPPSFRSVPGLVITLKLVPPGTNFSEILDPL